MPMGALGDGQLPSEGGGDMHAATVPAAKRKRGRNEGVSPRNILSGKRSRKERK